MKIIDHFIKYLRTKKAVDSIPQNSLVCDLGCGKEAYFLKKLSGFINYGFGIDKEVDYYKNGKIELKKIDFEKEKLPWQKEIFDAVTMLAVIEHLEKPEIVLKEIFRILKKGGSLILTTPAPRSKPLLEFLSHIGLINRKDILEHKHYLSPFEIKKLLMITGFQEEKIKIKYFEFGLNLFIKAVKGM